MNCSELEQTFSFEQGPELGITQVGVVKRVSAEQLILERGLAMKDLP